MKYKLKIYCWGGGLVKWVGVLSIHTTSYTKVIQNTSYTKHTKSQFLSAILFLVLSSRMLGRILDSATEFELQSDSSHTFKPHQKV